MVVELWRDYIQHLLSAHEPTHLIEQERIGRFSEQAQQLSYSPDQESKEREGQQGNKNTGGDIEDEQTDGTSDCGGEDYVTKPASIGHPRQQSHQAAEQTAA